MSPFFPKGFVVKGCACGIKKNRKDIGIVYSETPATAAALFTKNRFAAAPVMVSKKHLRVNTTKTIRAIVTNAGCANACTGTHGERDALQSARLVAAALKEHTHRVLVASTGPIGSLLPMREVAYGIQTLTSNLASFTQHDVRDFTEAIMTTDTFPKSATRVITLNGKKIRLWGAAKGAGMIHPTMATLLVFLATDCAIAQPVLQALLKDAVYNSFEAVTIDGDTSTNDSVFLLANGKAGNRVITRRTEKNARVFSSALASLTRKLAMMIARDGEGATRFAIITVKGARTVRDADIIAKTIATSPLVKTAFFGGDWNSGRILAAAGRAGVAFTPSKVDVTINTIVLVKNGTRTQQKPTVNTSKIKNISVVVHLHAGTAERTVYTCDLSYDYVKINAEYYT